MVQRNTLDTIGRAEKVNFPQLGILKVPARIDTGAKTSSVWASGMRLDKQRRLTFYLFDPTSPFYNGRLITTREYKQVMIASSNGTVQKRFKVKLSVVIKKRKIRASFTLSDRSQQAYAVLIGRNILRDKFIVDVKQGEPDTQKEQSRHKALQALLKDKS